MALGGEIYYICGRSRRRSDATSPLSAMSPRTNTTVPEAISSPTTPDIRHRSEHRAPPHAVRRSTDESLDIVDAPKACATCNEYCRFHLYSVFIHYNNAKIRSLTSVFHFSDLKNIKSTLLMILNHSLLHILNNGKNTQNVLLYQLNCFQIGTVYCKTYYEVRACKP